MSAEELIEDLQRRGFALRAEAGKVFVRLASQLTAADRAAIKRNCHALLVELVNPPMNSRLCPRCHVWPSPCPPYGWCWLCTEEAWAEVRRLGAGRAGAPAAARTNDENTDCEVPA